MKDHFSLAFSNLKRRGLRSWLTMIGIFVGIAAVVGLISLGQGLQSAIVEQFEQLGKNTIIIQSQTSNSFASSTSNSLILTTDNLEAIKGVRGVKEVVGILARVGLVGYKDKKGAALIIGINPEDINVFSKIQTFKIEEGRILEDGDNFKVIVGYNLGADGDVWEKGVEIGNSITIEGKEFKVIGIMAKTGDPSNDAGVYIPKETMKEVLGISNQEDEIIVKSEEGFVPSDVANAIKRELRQARGEKEGEETFIVQTSEELITSFTDIFNVVQWVLVGIAAISLLVGGIGIMNTMYTSVLERTKEIGTMKAVGAKNSDILQIFLFESGLLGLIGGVIGVCLGVALGKGVESIAANALGTNLLQASITFPLLAGALTFSFLIGTLSGVLPALQAARLKPADALRYE